MKSEREIPISTLANEREIVLHNDLKELCSNYKGNHKEVSAVLAFAIPYNPNDRIITHIDFKNYAADNVPNILRDLADKLDQQIKGMKISGGIN